MGRTPDAARRRITAVGRENAASRTLCKPPTKSRAEAMDSHFHHNTAIVFGHINDRPGMHASSWTLWNSKIVAQRPIGRAIDFFCAPHGARAARTLVR